MPSSCSLSLSLALALSFFFCHPAISVSLSFPALFSLSELENGFFFSFLFFFFFWSTVRRNKGEYDYWFSARRGLIGKQAVVIRTRVMASNVNLSRAISSSLPSRHVCTTQSHAGDNGGDVCAGMNVAPLRQKIGWMFVLLWMMLSEHPCEIVIYPLVLLFQALFPLEVDFIAWCRDSIPVGQFCRKNRSCRVFVRSFVQSRFWYVIQRLIM